MKILDKVVGGSYPRKQLNNILTFKSINNILYLIYSNKNKSLIGYDLDDQKKNNRNKELS